MPRPKRTKVAPSVPAPRVKKLAATKLTEAASEAPKSPFNDLYDASDSPERVENGVQYITKNNGKGKEVARNSDGEDDGILQQRGTLQEALGDDVEDLIGIETDLLSSSPEVEVGRREQRTPAMESSVLAIGNFRRRPRQPSILGRGAARHRSSSIESNLAETNGLTSVGRKNTSALARKGSGSQQREHSIMGKNTATATNNGLDIGATPKIGSAMKIGNFKRRAREPSILRTAQKTQPSRIFRDSDDEDEDDFNPDDESTPLNLPKTRNKAASPDISSSTSRKRKLSAVQNQRSSPSLPSHSATAREEETIPATYPENDEAENRDAPSDAEESVIASIERREETPELLSETMAPPLSSSPIIPSPIVASRQRQASSRGRATSRAKTPQTRYNDDSDIPSPPSLTHSPDRLVGATVRSKPRRQPPPSTFSTRQLQALLPRRRRRPVRDVFEIPTSDDEVDASGLASDDDELTHINARARTRRATTAPSRTPAPVIKKVTKLKSVRKETDGIRTYGSRGNVTSDKENEIDPNDSLAPLPDDENGASENSEEMEKRLGKELKQAAKKFAEVDKWEMEFEDVSAGNSSPKDAR